MWCCASVPAAITCLTRGADLLEQEQVVLCPPDCTQWRVSVFGTGTYASVSNVCGAAIHRGVVGPGGGPVQVRMLLGRRSYMSSYSNGIQSQSLSQWTSSFSLTKPVDTAQELSSETSTTTSLPGGKNVKKVLKKPAAKKPTVKKMANTECQVELAVVMDSSRNIGYRRFGLQKSFLSRLVTALKVGPTGPQVGVVQAGDFPRTEVHLSNSTKTLLMSIAELPYLGGDTNTGKAIQHVAESFFMAEHGMRRGHARVLLVLLDGWPSDDLEKAGELARDFGINVFLLSVAKPTLEEMPLIHDQDYAMKAVCKANGFFNLFAPSWFSAPKHIRSLTQRMCSPEALQCSRTCLNSVNIGFLIDGSSSVGDVNFRVVINFIKAIAQSLDISDVGSRVGVVQYTYEQRMEFGLSDHLSKEAVVGALNKIRYMNGGTATGGGHQLRITVFSVGVAWAPMQDLKAMASAPTDRHVFFSRDFSGLTAFPEALVRSVCQDFTHTN
ncbi:Cochlin [Merluccius polli]|uniref:Cochlin n=1 Tax=Merluccius polli TaxID=89951 RepID=A0AA47M540_MERPO|nr:Cochlin [Merluccius polli]